MEYKESLPIDTVLDSGVRKYKIKSVLGKGGFGITYLASSTVYVDNIPLVGQFAIKEHYISSMNERQGVSVSISNANNTEDFKESIVSFLVEAQRLNKLSLRNAGIVRVNENFRANGTAYYVMEYIKGQSLRDYVKNSSLGRLSEEEALKLFRPIAETIGYLHNNMVTHLDIKPDNILIRENGEPVVIDFGLSKHYNSKGTPTSTIKAAGCSAGYSPMEQYAGITIFSPEADIYALGATLLYMLTGKDPVISTEINENIIRQSFPTNISNQTKDAIVHAMGKLKENRTNNVKGLLNRMNSEGLRKDNNSAITISEKVWDNEKMLVNSDDSSHRTRIKRKSPKIKQGFSNIEVVFSKSFPPIPWRLIYKLLITVVLLAIIFGVTTLIWNKCTSSQILDMPSPSSADSANAILPEKVDSSIVDSSAEDNIVIKVAQNSSSEKIGNSLKDNSLVDQERKYNEYLQCLEDAKNAIAKGQFDKAEKCLKSARSYTIYAKNDKDRIAELEKKIVNRRQEAENDKLFSEAKKTSNMEIMRKLGKNDYLPACKELAYFYIEKHSKEGDCRAWHWAQKADEATKKEIRSRLETNGFFSTGSDKDCYGLIY